MGLAALVAVAARRAGLFRVEVRGRSMEPTLHDGDWLIARRTARISRGDVVVVELPGGRGEAVKRVVGLPGDRVGETKGVSAALGAGELYVVGDNPSESTDSRRLGPVPRESVAGVVLWRYWPRPGPVISDSHNGPLQK